MNDGRTHNTKFIHSLDPISPQGHAAHRHPYIYDPKTNWRGGDIAARQVGGYDMARRREDIRKEGIDKQLIFPTQITVATSNIGPLGRECARLFNDWVARLVKGNEDVFLPCAMAAAGCPEAMADELRRCVEQHGFRASHLAPYCVTRNLDDPAYLPYFAAAERLGAIIRAGVDDREMVDALGIDIKVVFNRVFVLAQYFDYLRRNPNTTPDSDYTGYDFWLTKLNQFNGNFVSAEMVKAFITSTEYRQRFGP